jgi:hypothetical protein
MFKHFVFSLASLVFVCQASAKPELECTPLGEISRPTLYEIGLTFPLFSNDARNFINSTGINPTPLSTGFGTGAQIGYHKLIRERATFGALVNASMFLDNSQTTTQIYQASAVAVGRLFFMKNWTNSVFAEIGAGPEVTAYSVSGGSFNTQVSIASRFGIGYSYEVDNNVCVTASAVISPNFASNDPTRNAKIIVSMVW